MHATCLSSRSAELSRQMSEEIGSVELSISRCHMSLGEVSKALDPDMIGAVPTPDAPHASSENHGNPSPEATIQESTRTRAMLCSMSEEPARQDAGCTRSSPTILQGVSESSMRQTSDALDRTVAWEFACGKVHTQDVVADHSFDSFICLPVTTVCSSIVKPGHPVVAKHADKLERLTKTASSPGVPTAKRTLLASRGGGVEGSEGFLNNPHLSLRLPAGGTQVATIEASDLTTLLRHCAQERNVQPVQSFVMQSEGDLVEEFVFIPPLILGSLLSYYQDVLSLQCSYVFL